MTFYVSNKITGVIEVHVFYPFLSTQKIMDFFSVYGGCVFFIRLHKKLEAFRVSNRYQSKITSVTVVFYINFFHFSNMLCKL